MNRSYEALNTTKQIKCDLLNPTNSTKHFVDENWENIPETLVINVVIGMVLFCIFKLLTYIAWNQVHENSISEGLISFLYGYRDPERWYVIPRFEFLRRTELHHNHDLNAQNIYVPPKLPLANPLELVSVEDITTRSFDDKPSGKSPSIRDTLGIGNFLKKTLPNQATIKTNQNSTAIKSSKTKQNQDKDSEQPIPDDPLNIEAATKTTGSLLSQTQHQPPPSSPADSLANNFFYPSILTAEQLQATWLSRKLNRFFSIFFKVTDADMIYLKGIDAYEYLLFQRHLIFIMTIVTILCLTVILPINMMAKTTSEFTFQTTTIRNIPDDSHLYLAHILCSILMIVVSITALNSYKSSIITKDEAQLARRTILIGNIPVEQRNRQKLTEVLRQNFANSTIEAIQFVYDTSLLEQYQAQLSTLVVAKNYCFYYKEKNNGRELMVKKTEVNEDQKCGGNCRCCSFIFVSCCRWPYETKQPGTEFYTKREKYYRTKIKHHVESLVKAPSEYAFVTFKSNKQTRRLMERLAYLKHDAFFGDSRPNKQLENPDSVILKSRKAFPRPVKSPPEGSNSSRDCLKKTEPDKTQSKNKPTIASQFITYDGLEELDPLDVSNNPHVKSIRTPIKRTKLNIVPQKRTIATSGSGITNKDSYGTGNSNNKNNKPETGNEIDRPFDSREVSTMDHQSGPLSWSVRYAPHPDNIDHRDLLNMATTKNYTLVLLHILMLIIFIFFTTPNVILSMVDTIIKETQKDKVLGPKDSDRGPYDLPTYKSVALNYLVILIQAVTSSVLPSLITLISKQIPYEDAASKSHSIMWKSYIFLVMMVIIMPSIGMTSAQALFSSKIVWECLFISDNGSYFINYVVTQTFLSSILELIKPTDIIFYTFILWTGRSTADFEGGRQFIEREFSVGMQHTTVLLIFSTVMTYSISCPLIAPFGLIYLCVKHAVDHYHLFYVYFTKKVDKNQQTTIMVFVRVALLLMLFQTTTSITINTRAGFYSFVIQIAFGLSLCLFCCRIFFFCTTQSAEERRPKKSRFQRDFCACFYMPRVMDDLLRLNAMPESCISRQV